MCAASGHRPVLLSALILTRIRPAALASADDGNSTNSNQDRKGQHILFNGCHVCLSLARSTAGSIPLVVVLAVATTTPAVGFSFSQSLSGQ